MRDQLEQSLARFEELERQLVDPEVLASSARLSAVAREHGALAKLATKYRRFKKTTAQIAEALEMAGSADPEMRQLAEAELPQLRADREGLWNELLDMTVGGEDAGRSRCIWRSAPAPAATRPRCSPAISMKCTSTMPKAAAGRWKFST